MKCIVATMLVLCLCCVVSLPKFAEASHKSKSYSKSYSRSSSSGYSSGCPQGGCPSSRPATYYVQAKPRVGTTRVQTRTYVQRVKPAAAPPVYYYSGPARASASSGIVKTKSVKKSKTVRR